MAEPIKVTVSDAINHIKIWISNNELEKAEQGINEVLEFEPDNLDAKKFAEEVKAKKEKEKPEIKAEQVIAPQTPAVEAPKPLAPVIQSAPAAVPVAVKVPAKKLSKTALLAVASVFLVAIAAGYFASKYLKIPEEALPEESAIQAQAVGEVQSAVQTEVPQTEGSKEEASVQTAESAQTEQEQQKEAAPEQAPQGGVEAVPQTGAEVGAQTEQTAPQTEQVAPAAPSAPAETAIQEQALGAQPSEEVKTEELQKQAAENIEIQPSAEAVAEITEMHGRTPFQLILEIFTFNKSAGQTGIQLQQEETAETVFEPTQEPEVTRVKVKRR